MDQADQKFSCSRLADADMDQGGQKFSCSRLEDNDLVSRKTVWLVKPEV